MYRLAFSLSSGKPYGAYHWSYSQPPNWNKGNTIVWLVPAVQLQCSELLCSGPVLICTLQNCLWYILGQCDVCQSVAPVSIRLELCFCHFSYHNYKFESHLKNFIDLKKCLYLFTGVANTRGLHSFWFTFNLARTPDSPEIYEQMQLPCTE